MFHVNVCLPSVQIKTTLLRKLLCIYLLICMCVWIILIAVSSSLKFIAYMSFSLNIYHSMYHLKLYADHKFDFINENDL